MIERQHFAENEFSFLALVHGHVDILSPHRQVVRILLEDAPTCVFGHLLLLPFLGEQRFLTADD